MTTETTIQIGELALKLNITTRTIRYYEEIGLMDPPQRLNGGKRVYTKEDVRRLKFILKLKELGISLKEMQELARIYRVRGDTDTIMPVLIEILDKHIATIDEKISRITSLRSDISTYRSRIVEIINGTTQTSEHRPSGTI